MPINSIYSAYGHRFISTGDEARDACLTCGAMYELAATPDASHDGDYFAANGDAPKQCTGDTSMIHGYPGECCGGNTDHDCNCLFCA